MAARSVYRIPRNNVAACTAYYESRGRITRDEAQVMAMLQDDAAELRAIMQGWTIVDAMLPPTP